MKIHIDIPPESPAVQRLITETKMYWDKLDSLGLPAFIRGIHLSFVGVMMLLFILVLVSWKTKLCWFSYEFSVAVDWIFLVSMTTRVAWGICANVVLIREWRLISTSAPKSEEQKGLLEDVVDRQDKTEIQKYSITLAEARKNYEGFVREICLWEALVTFYLSGFLCGIVSFKLASNRIIPYWIAEKIAFTIGGFGGVVAFLVFVGSVFYKCYWKKRNVQ